jgi:hypothetical protein
MLTSPSPGRVRYDVTVNYSVMSYSTRGWTNLASPQDQGCRHCQESKEAKFHLILLINMLLINNNKKKATFVDFGCGQEKHCC